MAIDNTIYAKYSGRRTDPSRQLGAALSAQTAQNSARRRALDRSFSELYGLGQAVSALFLIATLAAIFAIAAVVLY